MRRFSIAFFSGCALTTAAQACDLPKSLDPARAGFVKPIEAEIGPGFGLRLHPILQTMRQHHGLDFIAAIGEPVTAAASGRVIEAKYQGAYGNTVRIEHGGEVTTLYAHLSRHAAGLSEGACVKAGDVIGFVGNTGFSSQPHLHFEVHQGGTPIDPAPALGLPVRGESDGVK